MSSFTPLTKKKAIKITENLIKHPCSVSFRQPVVIGVEADPDYYARIKKPIDLTSILRKLKNDEYELISEWLIDVETCWWNCEQYQPDTLYAVCAHFMRNVFNHERKNMCISLAAWCSRIFDLRLKYATLEQKAPSKMRSYSISNTIIPSEEKIESSFSGHEIQCLIIAIEMLTTQEEVQEIQKIITDSNIEINFLTDPVSFCLPRLPWRTLIKIQNYLQKALQKKDLEYPS